MLEPEHVIFGPPAPTNTPGPGRGHTPVKPRSEAPRESLTTLPDTGNDGSAWDDPSWDDAGGDDSSRENAEHDTIPAPPFAEEGEDGDED
ncbi:MAG TPA: hypothetical protein VF989_07980 [Polyangiaceae bacterium]